VRPRVSEDRQHQPTVRVPYALPAIFRDAKGIPNSRYGGQHQSGPFPHTRPECTRDGTSWPPTPRSESRCLALLADDVSQLNQGREEAFLLPWSHDAEIEVPPDTRIPSRNSRFEDNHVDEIITDMPGYSDKGLYVDLTGRSCSDARAGLLRTPGAVLDASL